MNHLSFIDLFRSNVIKIPYLQVKIIDSKTDRIETDA